jgi:hypothetical protein
VKFHEFQGEAVSNRRGDLEIALRCPGSARASRAGFGASPKQPSGAGAGYLLIGGQVRDGEGAIAGTRGACAPRNTPFAPLVDIRAKYKLWTKER